VKYKKLIK
jgi:hypothetical protein